MIKLTRLDGEPFVLNAELIRYVECRPDTFITLTSGERLVVSETMDQVIERAVEYQQHKHFIPMPKGSPAGSPIQRDWSRHRRLVDPSRWQVTREHTGNN